MSNAAAQAEVLNQALPYIQRFAGQTFVVKYGGSAMKDPSALAGVLRNVLLMQAVGIRTVLVHGGGPEIDRWLERVGIPKRVERGLRVTDDATMEVVEMALLRANQSLVAEIQRLGGRAVGLSGRDAGLFRAEAVSDVHGRAGRVVAVSPGLVLDLTGQGYVPVVCSVAADREGGPMNVNADVAAGALASAVGANKLILLSDTEGVLEDKDRPETRISHLSAERAREMLATGAADRGMIPKLESALAALEGGVPSVHVIHGGTPNALLIEVFTDGGIGTMLTVGSGSTGS